MCATVDIRTNEVDSEHANAMSHYSRNARSKSTACLRCRYGQQPTEIFSKVCAFHIKFDEQPLDKNVANWSVKVLSLSQTKRHLDRAVLHGFWNTLDRFMVKNKPFLRY